MSNTEICLMTAIELVEAVKSKKLSPVEIVDAVLQRIERLNPKVNAYCTVAAESARKQAREAEASVTRRDRLGPLHGVPVSIKDSIYTRGIRSTIGSRMYENFVPDQDAIVVERLKVAGAIIIGKTNTPEFCLMGTTENHLFGVTRNPWNLELTPGGSSGGSAAAVAACMGPLSLGSDGGGSIRLPSSFCGVVGVKPSFGRVPQYPNFPGWGDTELITTGPIARSVADAALALQVIAGRHDSDRYSLPDRELSYLQSLAGVKGMKIAWSKDLGYGEVDPRVAVATERAVETFEKLGCTVEAVEPKGASLLMSYAVIVAAMHAAALRDKMEGWRNQMHPSVIAFVEMGMNKSGIDLARAWADRADYWEAIRPIFEKYDLLLTPTAAVPAFKISEDRETPRVGLEEAIRTGRDWLVFTYPFNMTGQPAASVPCGWTDDNLPIGLQIVGRRFDELTVLKAAAAFEQASPWRGRLPPLDQPA